LYFDRPFIGYDCQSKLLESAPDYRAGSLGADNNCEWCVNSALQAISE
jgi:hypothetical protein